MKYLLIFITVIIVNTTSAQTKSQTANPTSKDTTSNVNASKWTASSQNINPTSTPALTGTTINVSAAKWAVLEIYNCQSAPIIWIVFDNGIKIDLYTLFHADTRLAQTHNA